MGWQDKNTENDTPATVQMMRVDNDALVSNQGHPNLSTTSET